LPVGENYRSINVKKQERDPYSTLNFYRRLLKLRREHRALHAGRFEFFDSIPAGVLAYIRAADGQSLLVLVNFEHKAHCLDLSALGAGASTLLSTVPGKQERVDLSRVELGPNQSLVLQLD
jgi:glycosidase